MPQQPVNRFTQHGEEIKSEKELIGAAPSGPTTTPGPIAGAPKGCGTNHCSLSQYFTPKRWEATVWEEGK